MVKLSNNEVKRFDDIVVCLIPNCSTGYIDKFLSGCYNFNNLEKNRTSAVWKNLYGKVLSLVPL